MSLNTATFTGARIVGAALGGALVATIGLAPLFLVNGISYLAVVVALLAMRTSELHPRELVPKAKGQIREGIRYVWRTADLRIPMIAMLVVFTFAFNWQVLIPLYATRDLGGDAGLFGDPDGGVRGGIAGRGAGDGRPVVAAESAAAGAAGAGAGRVYRGAGDRGHARGGVRGAPLVGAAGIAFAITANSTLQLTPRTGCAAG